MLAVSGTWGANAARPRPALTRRRLVARQPGPGGRAARPSSSPAGDASFDDVKPFH